MSAMLGVIDPSLAGRSTMVLRTEDTGLRRSQHHPQLPVKLRLKPLTARIDTDLVGLRRSFTGGPYQSCLEERPRSPGAFPAATTERPLWFSTIQSTGVLNSDSTHNSRAGHPASRCCSSLTYAQYARSSRLAIRAPRSGTYARNHCSRTLARNDPRRMDFMRTRALLVFAGVLMVGAGAIAAQQAGTAPPTPASSAPAQPQIQLAPGL